MNLSFEEIAYRDNISPEIQAVMKQNLPLIMAQANAEMAHARFPSREEVELAYKREMAEREEARAKMQVSALLAAHGLTPEFILAALKKVGPVGEKVASAMVTEMNKNIGQSAPVTPPKRDAALFTQEQAQAELVRHEREIAMGGGTKPAPAAPLDNGPAPPPKAEVQQTVMNTEVMQRRAIEDQLLENERKRLAEMLGCTVEPQAVPQFEVVKSGSGKHVSVSVEAKIGEILGAQPK